MEFGFARARLGEGDFRWRILKPGKEVSGLGLDGIQEVVFQWWAEGWGGPWWRQSGGGTYYWRVAVHLLRFGSLLEHSFLV